MGALIQFKDSAVLLEFPRTVQSLRGTLSSALKRHRLPELLIENLIREAEIQADATPEEALAWALTQLSLPRAIDFEKARGILLVGPAGGGKSAVAAKIAHTALLLGRKVEMASAADGLALFRTASFESDSLMVMEAQGFNPSNRRALNAFAALGEAGDVETIAVVSASSDAEDMSEIVSALRPPRVIVSGLDRTSRLGATVAAICSGAQLAHVTYGPRADDPLESLPASLLAKMLLD